MDESWKSFIVSPYVCDALKREPQEYLAARPPIASTERLAFPHPNSLKRSALLVDRIYLPSWTPAWADNDIPLDLTFGDPSLDHETAEKSWMYVEVDFPWKLDDPVAKVHHLLEIYLRGPLLLYRASHPRASIVPINYDVGTAVLPSGTDEVYQGVLHNLPVVLEDALTWSHVVEFRQDPEARRKFRDLHLWLESLDGRSERQAADLIGQKIEDYRWAIKKHGLATAIQGISSFVSLGAIVPAAGGFAAEAARISPAWGAAVGGALAVAGASAWVGKRLLDRQDAVRGAHREVAYLFDVQNLAPRP